MFPIGSLLALYWCDVVVVVVLTNLSSKQKYSYLYKGYLCASMYTYLNKGPIGQIGPGTHLGPLAQAGPGPSWAHWPIWTRVPFGPIGPIGPGTNILTFREGPELFLQSMHIQIYIYRFRKWTFKIELKWNIQMSISTHSMRHFWIYCHIIQTNNCYPILGGSGLSLYFP